MTKILCRYLFSHLKYCGKETFFFVVDPSSFQSSLGTRLCLHHCFPTTLEFWILKTSIEIEPSISLVVLMDSKERSGDTVRRRVLNIMKPCPPGYLDRDTHGRMVQGLPALEKNTWILSLCLHQNSWETMVLPSTKTVFYKYENVSQMILFMCWQTSFLNLTSLSLLDLSVSWVVLDLCKHSLSQ